MAKTLSKSVFQIKICAKLKSFIRDYWFMNKTIDPFPCLKALNETKKWYIFFL
jgi:hypothetical protein